MNIHFSNTIKSIFINTTKVAISIGLLYYVFKDIDLQSLTKQISQTSITSLLLYFFISLFLLLLASYRWSLLLLDKPSVTNILHCYKANIIALFYNLFLPTAYGGDLLKWTHLASFNLPRRTLLLSVLADRVIGVMGLITVGFIASVLAQKYNLAEVPLVLSWLFLLLFIGLLVVLLILFTPLKVSQLPVLNRFRILSELDEYLEIRKMRLLFLFILAIVIQLGTFFSFYILAIEAQIHLSFVYFLLVSPVVSLISVLPISVAGFGTTEASYLYFFEPLSVTNESILVFTSLLGIFKIFLGLLGWFTQLVITGKRLTRNTIKN